MPRFSAAARQQIRDDLMALMEARAAEEEERAQQIARHQARRARPAATSAVPAGRATPHPKKLPSR